MTSKSFFHCRIGAQGWRFAVKWSNNGFHFLYIQSGRLRRFWPQYFFSSFLTDSDSLSLPPIEHQLQRHPSPPPTRSEILCNSQEQDKFLPDDGIDSSVTIDLRPGRTMNSCKRYFIAPESSGLFIRLVRSDQNQNDTYRRNLTEFCPLSIVSIDRDRPWHWENLRIFVVWVFNYREIFFIICLDTELKFNIFNVIFFMVIKVKIEIFCWNWKIIFYIF